MACASREGRAEAAKWHWTRAAARPCDERPAPPQRESVRMPRSPRIRVPGAPPSPAAGVFMGHAGKEQVTMVSRFRNTLRFMRCPGVLADMAIAWRSGAPVTGGMGAHVCFPRGAATAREANAGNPAARGRGKATVWRTDRTGRSGRANRMDPRMGRPHPTSRPPRRHGAFPGRACYMPRMTRLPLRPAHPASTRRRPL
jgi:hypothetical protein